MACNLRQATSVDIPAIVFLLHQLFSIEKDFIVDQEKQIRGLELLLERADALVLVAQSQNEVIGTITVQSLVSTAEGGVVGLVEDVVVKAGHQGNGVGKLLVEAACSWAAKNNMTRLQLLADRTNAPALAFYAKMGWDTTSMIALRKGIMPGRCR